MSTEGVPDPEKAQALDLVFNSYGYRRARRTLRANEHASTLTAAGTLLDEIIFEQLGGTVGEGGDPGEGDESSMIGFNVEDLGVEPGNNVAGNAALINDSLLDRTQRLPLCFPGGDYDITEMIYVPWRTGYKLSGAGRTYPLNDLSYSELFRGGQHASRLIWHGSTNGTMMQINGLGDTVEGINFEGSRNNPDGSPLSGWVIPRVGIHVRTIEETGMPTGKLAIRDCSFANVGTALLFGPELDDAVNEGNNADESSFDNLWFYYPYANMHTQERTCFRFRNRQAVNWHVGRITVNGNPNEVFWFEKGGKLKADYVCLGNLANATDPCTLLRLGDESAGDFRIHFDLDGVCTGTRLLYMDTGVYNCYVELSGNCGLEAETILKPRIVARGSSKIVLKGVNGLRNADIQAIGTPQGSFPARVCWIHLEDCTMDYRVTAMTDVLDAANCVAPYVLTWKNCGSNFAGAFPTGFEGRPFADGQSLSGVTAIS